MGTSQPVRKTHDIPIVEPEKPILPLPEPDPSKIITINPVPVKQPEQEPARRREIRWV